MSHDSLRSYKYSQIQLQWAVMPAGENNPKWIHPEAKPPPHTHTYTHVYKIIYDQRGHNHLLLHIENPKETLIRPELEILKITISTQKAQYYYVQKQTDIKTGIHFYKAAYRGHICPVFATLKACLYLKT